MSAEQLPVENAYTVGGQSTVENHVVGQEVDGFIEVGESKQNAAGQHQCDITYSRRKTKSLTLQLGSSATVTDYCEGGHVDSSFAFGGVAAWEITGVQRVQTRGPVQLNLELISITEEITAP